MNFLNERRTETQAQAQQQNSTNALDITSGGILNHTGQFELLMATQEHPKRLTCELRDMKLENIIRPIHSSNKTITNEKYSILFQTRFQTVHMQFNVIQFIRLLVDFYFDIQLI